LLSPVINYRNGEVALESIKAEDLEMMGGFYYRLSASAIDSGLSLTAPKLALPNNLRQYLQP